MIKFASTRVKGWTTRWEHPIATQDLLWARQARGYTLAHDEENFVRDVMSLRAKYNKTVFEQVLKEAAE